MSNQKQIADAIKMEYREEVSGYMDDIRKKKFKDKYKPKHQIQSVKNVIEAINHINKYGTQHTDAIICKNKNTSKIFLKNIYILICIGLENLKLVLIMC